MPLLRILVFFAAMPNTDCQQGAIGVLDLKRATELAGTRDLRLIDLTRHPWAPRPRRQCAYGLSDGVVTSNFKDADVCAKLGLEWYRFFKEKGVEVQRVARAEHLLDATDDVMAGLLLLAVDEYVNLEGPLTSTVADCSPHGYRVFVWWRGETQKVTPTIQSSSHGARLA